MSQPVRDQEIVPGFALQAEDLGPRFLATERRLPMALDHALERTLVVPDLAAEPVLGETGRGEGVGDQLADRRRHPGTVGAALHGR